LRGVCSIPEQDERKLILDHFDVLFEAPVPDFKAQFSTLIGQDAKCDPGILLPSSKPLK
jgi:hypothetical protein